MLKEVQRNKKVLNELGPRYRLIVWICYLALFEILFVLIQFHRNYFDEVLQEHLARQHRLLLHYLFYEELLFWASLVGLLYGLYGCFLVKILGRLVEWNLFILALIGPLLGLFYSFIIWVFRPQFTFGSSFFDSQWASFLVVLRRLIELALFRSSTAAISHCSEYFKSKRYIIN